ncbi:MAG: AAA family ATPase [Gemmatimonadaceae bacterium]
MLSLRALGRLDLRADGAPVLAGRRKPLALLAFLSRHAGRPLPRIELADLLWGDSDEALARKSLRQALFELRPVLGDRLTASDSSVAIVEGGLDVDIDAFEADVSAGRWAAAIDRYAGDLLNGMEDVGGERWNAWLESERQGLRKLLAIAFERLAAESESRGAWSELAAAADRWTTLLPTDERGAIRLVTALRLLDRPAEASAKHAAFLQRMRGEFGLEPTAALTALGQTTFREALQPAVGSPGARALLTPDLIGRSEEFAALTAAWQATRAGSVGQVVVVSADEGLGKTRLVSDFLRQLREQRPAPYVIETRAHLTEQEHPFAAVRSVVMQLAEAPGITGTAPEVLAGLASVAPDLRSHFRHLPASPATSSSSEVGEWLLRAVGDAADEQPLVLLVDDAADADPASAEALAVLVRRPPAQVLVLLTGRPSAWPASRLHGDVERERANLRRIELDALSETETLAMLSSVVPLAPEAGRDLARRLHVESGGNPGQVLQLLAHLADGGDVAPGAGGLWGVTRGSPEAPLPLPASLKEAFLARLSHLGADARQLVELAAVSGPDASTDVLERASQLPSATFRSALGQVLSARVLRDGGRGRGLEFLGDANRRAVYDGLAPSRRRELHGEMQRALTASGASADRIKYHRALAGPTSRRNRIRWAVAGVAAVLAMTLGVFVWRSRAARVAPGSAVLIADVQNLTGDSLFGRAVLTAATVQLQQSSRISVFPRARVLQTLARMQRQREDTALAESLAREVAEREGVPVVLVFGVARFDSTYELTARIVDPTSGRDLRTERVRADTRADVIPALGKLVSATQRDLGESRVASAGDLPRVTTSSLEALRAFAAGNRAWSARDYPLARDEYLRAVALDSGFSLAWSGLAEYAYLQGMDQRDGDKYLDRALANVSRLTEREQITLRAKEQSYRGNPDEAIRLRKVLAERFPERENWFNLGTSLMRRRRCGEAIPALRQAIRFDSLFTNAWINIATCEQFEGKLTDAIADYAHAATTDSLALIRGNINHEFGIGLMRLGMLDSAEHVFRMQASRANPDDARKGYRSLGYLQMLRGKYASASSLLDTAFAMDSLAHAWTSVFRDAILRAQSARALGDAARARRAVDDAWSAFKSRPVDLAIVAVGALEIADQGAIGPATAMLDTVKAQSHTGSADDDSKRQMLLGHVELARGRPARALEALRLATDTVYQVSRQTAMAHAFAALGQVDSALVLAEAVHRVPRIGDEQQDAWLQAPLLIARLALRQGDTTRARAAYEEILKRWKDGDPTLPALLEARRATEHGVVQPRDRATVARPIR